MLRVAEIFSSLQGETQYAGLPCVFVRLAGCPHACVYCDTPRAWSGGALLSEEEIIERVRSLGGIRLVEVTGGEPLHQEDTPLLLQRLCGAGFSVLLETSGHEPLTLVPSFVSVLMDVKTPDSGAAGLCEENLQRLKHGDALKFVLCGPADFHWAAAFVRDRRLIDREFPVFFIPAHGRVEPADLADWILQARLPVHLGLQFHKLLWGADTTR
jgi:7-carboxy-7-deazaguanine synthase